MRLYLLDDETMGLDPLDSIQLTQGQRTQRFIPIDEVPDENLDPFEALALKEEAALALPGQNGHHVEINGHAAGMTHLEAPESLRLEWYYHESDEIPPLLPADPGASTIKDNGVEDVEHALSCKRSHRREIWIVSCESHGRHGRKPTYKDKISHTVRY